jgi:hypothetical protein
LQHIEIEQASPQRRDMMRDGGLRRRRDAGAPKLPKTLDEEPK